MYNIEKYDRYSAEEKLLLKLQEAEETIKEESDWITLDDLKKTIDENKSQRRQGIRISGRSGRKIMMQYIKL